MNITKKERDYLYDYVYDFKTKYKEGFIPEELDTILLHFLGLYDLEMHYYNLAMRGNTCLIRKEGFVIYHTDVYHSLLAGIENRRLNLEEWD